MPLKVAAGLRTAIRRSPGSILVQIQRATDPGLAAAALARARDDIAQLDGGWQSSPGLRPGDRNGPTYLSPVVDAPSGALLYVDGGHTPSDLLETIPEIITARLEQAGVRDALVSSPASQGPLSDLDLLPRAVVLYLYPPPLVDGRGRPRAIVPDRWLDEVWSWLTATARDGQVLAEVIAQFTLDASEGASAFQLARRARAGTFVAGDVTARVRGVHGRFIGSECLALAAGGPASTDEELLTELAGLIQQARSLAADVAYAFIAVEPCFALFSALDCGTEWYRTGGAPPQSVRDGADEIVLDGFHYQLLGPRHVDRVGAASPLEDRLSSDDAVQQLDERHLELRIGAPADWLITDPPRIDGLSAWWIGLGSRRQNPDVQARARAVLAECLLSEEQARALLGERRLRGST